MHPSFASYMESCLYDSETGYYGSGNVEFGGQPHFWTYPQLLSPIFGWALAEQIRDIVERWTEAGLLNDSETVTVLELGGGDGVMARDALDYVVAHSGDAAWRPYADRFEYVIGELSPSLRRKQERCIAEHIENRRARVVHFDARDSIWDEQFKGVVVCNELLDAFPCERLRIGASQAAVSRVHVNEFPQDFRAGPDSVEQLVPLAAGWLYPDGNRGEPPEPLLEYLTSIAPLVEDLANSDLLPVDIYWPPSLTSFAERLGRLLTRPGNVGTALVIDYGGSSRHLLDPRALASHIRVYGPGRELAHTAEVYGDPGRRDITCDVDFTELARLARVFGLDVECLEHQSAIEGGAVDFDSPRTLDALADRMSTNAGYAAGVAKLVAPKLVKRFRRSPCYWLVRLQRVDDTASTPPSQEAIRLDGRELWTVAASVGRQEIERTLVEAGLPAGLSSGLKPCGDIAADLSDLNHLSHYHRVCELLDERGWLRAPGEVATHCDTTK